jgi:hypothetical protein
MSLGAAGVKMERANSASPHQHITVSIKQNVQNGCLVAASPSSWDWTLHKNNAASRSAQCCAEQKEILHTLRVIHASLS